MSLFPIHLAVVKVDGLNVFFFYSLSSFSERQLFSVSVSLFLPPETKTFHPFGISFFFSFDST